MGTLLKVLGVFIVVVIVVSMFGEEEEPTTSPVERQAERQDKREERSRLACDHFRNVAADAEILTDQELREKLKEVDDNSIIATPKVRVAARGLLASVTSGDIDQFAVSAKKMFKACEAAGH